MVMKFSGKPITFNKGHTVADHSAVVEALLGSTTGASKGSPAPTDWKIRPTGKPWKGSIGIKATKKF